MDARQHNADGHERVLYGQRHQEVIAHLMKAPVETNDGAGHGAAGQHGRRYGQQAGRQRRPAAADRSHRHCRR